MKVSKHPPSPMHLRALVATLFAGVLVGPAQAWTLNIAAAPRRVYLQVGNGLPYANSAQINQVSVTVPSAQVGTGTAQPMTSNSTQSRSPLDNYLVCVPPQQVFVGASYQRSSSTNGPASALLQVTSQPNLVSANGETIPFSQISWRTSALGPDTTPNVIPAGSFNGGTQTLTSVRANTFVENCHSFTYANTVRRSAGTYTGQVTYTISTP
jgi:hypothetical protein